MKPSSRKAKGRYLQNIVRDRIIRLYPVLTKKDIRTSMISENGADVKLLTHTARKLFPYSVEWRTEETSLLYSLILLRQKGTLSWNHC